MHIYDNRKKMRQLISILATGCLSAGITMNAHAQLKSFQPVSTVSIATIKPSREAQIAALQPSLFKESNRVEVSQQILPSIDKIEVFKLTTKTEEGFNAVTQVTFKRGQRSKVIERGEFVSIIDDKEKLAFNDNGIAPDVKPGDGTFTAFSRVDFRKMAADEAKAIDSLRRADVKSVTEFSGRTVKSTSSFSINTALESLKKIELTKVSFDKNVVGVLVPSIFQAIPQIPFTADENKVLGVHSTSVVAHPGFTFDPCNTDGTGNNVNPNAPWSFKTLMSNLNQGTGLTNQQFIHEWLRKWRVMDNVNSQNIFPRPAIIDYFPGWDGVNAATLNINNLPFRLLSIMNRLDLSKVSYLSATEGETRFVFGLLNPSTCGPAVGINQMTAIFEYGDTAKSCSTIKSRAQQWLALDGLALGSVAYMNALKAITDDVTLAPGAAENLNQLRTNDFAFDGLNSLAMDWNLREFMIDTVTGRLVHTTTKQTPAASFRTGSPVLAQFMEDNANAILCENHVVPETFNGNPFLAASLDYMSTSFWSAPTNQANLPAAFPSCHQSSTTAVSPFLPIATQVQAELRHKFSVNTCDDCHARETSTTFTHVNPITRGFSGFMTGITVTDPLLGGAGAGGITRTFDDLQRRGQIVQDLAVRQCNGGLVLASPLMEKSLPINFIH